MPAHRITWYFSRLIMTHPEITKQIDHKKEKNDVDAGERKKKARVPPHNFFSVILSTTLCLFYNKR